LDNVHGAEETYRLRVKNAWVIFRELRRHTVQGAGSSIDIWRNFRVSKGAKV